jgi:hypothetical protein
MLQSQLIGILGLVAIAACWGLAVVLYRVGTAGSVARKLAVLSVVEGIVLITAGFPEFAFGVPMSFYDAHSTLRFLSGMVHHFSDAVMIVLYPSFLALALNTKLTRVFTDTSVRIGLAIGSSVLVLAVVFSPSRIIVTLLYSIVTLLFVYALVASIHAWRTANRGVARERASIFALAFGLRDLGWGLSYAIAAWLMWTEPDQVAMTNLAWLGKLVYALGTLVSIPLIAYGILRTQLFDIDLRIRWTIKQSTVAAVFITVFYLVSEGADRMLASEFGNMLGLMASGLVVFFLVPVQKFAERIASAAMPNSENTPEYAMFRKMQVYEAALTEALPDGNISERERGLLNSLRDSLGLSVSDAEAIEGELKMGQSNFA